MRVHVSVILITFEICGPFVELIICMKLIHSTSIYGLLDPVGCRAKGTNFHCQQIRWYTPHSFSKRMQHTFVECNSHWGRSDVINNFTCGHFPHFSDLISYRLRSSLFQFETSKTTQILVNDSYHRHHMHIQSFHMVLWPIIAI